MSIKIMTAVWGLRLPDSEKIVLLALADCANDEGVCWPSMSSLAAKCSKSDRTVQASVKSLEAAGHLTRDERPGRGVLYTIHPSAAPETASPEAVSPPKRLRPRSGFTPEAVSPTPEAASDKPSRTTISSSEASPPAKTGASAPSRRWPVNMPPPNGVSDDQWAGFVDNRKRLRAALTPRAYQLLVEKLGTLSRDGWPPGEMIDRAVEHGWKSVFPPDENRNGKRPHHDRPSGWAPRPGMEGAEPASLDD